MTELTLAEYIMRNTGLEEAQAGIMIARRNINKINIIPVCLENNISTTEFYLRNCSF